MSNLPEDVTHNDYDPIPPTWGQADPDAEYDPDEDKEDDD
jgi:hypothetical protein